MVRRAGHRGASRSQVFHHERLNRSGTLRGAESADPFAVASKEARVAREIVRIEKAPVLDQQRTDFFDVFEALNPCSGGCSVACAALRSRSEGDRRRRRESCSSYESFELAMARNLHGTLPSCGCALEVVIELPQSRRQPGVRATTDRRLRPGPAALAPLQGMRDPPMTVSDGALQAPAARR